MTDAEVPVHIYMLLDRTGSMNLRKTDVIGGFNSFLSEQKAKPGKCRFTLVQFDSVDPFEVLLDAVPLKDVPDLTEATFVPRGSTPLLDAEGRLMIKALERESVRDSAGKAQEAILFVTYTDGLENASREWTYEMVAAKKRELEKRWAFLYLGVGHDAYAQASQIGTMAANTVSAQSASQAYDGYSISANTVRRRAAAGQQTNSTDLAAEN